MKTKTDKLRENYHDSIVELVNGQFALVQLDDNEDIIEVDLLQASRKGHKWVTSKPIKIPVSSVKRELSWNEIQALKIED